MFSGHNTGHHGLADEGVGIVSDEREEVPA